MQIGRPSVPADVIAAVMVLQSLEGLSDRDATRALRDRISWKVACGLALDDGGFHHSVLTYWRTRLRTSVNPQRIFERRVSDDAHRKAECALRDHRTLGRYLHQTATARLQIDRAKIRAEERQVLAVDLGPRPLR